MVGALWSKWKDLLLRLFDIRVGEFRRVGLMQLNIFLLIQCLWIIKPVVNAQFLSRVGIARLPLVFLLVALTALAVSTVYSRLLSRLSLGTLMLRTYLISILCLFTFAILLRFHLFIDWMSYLFYIGVALFGLITTSQFWLLGNMIFNSLEAKRLFGFIGAGAIAGGISGGYVTSLLAPVVDSINLLFLAAGLLMISMVVNHRIWVKFVPAFNTSVQIRQTKTLHEYPLRLIRNSKHLTYLALILAISVVVAKLVEFQYSAIASANILDPDELTSFFGFWFSTANVVSLFIQLVITRRVVGFLGVGRSLFVLPGALFAGAAAVLNAPVLWAGTTLKLFDISLKQSINKAATELLILPIPIAIKNQAKTYIDVFVDTTATGIGGILLIFLVNGLDLSVRAVCIMILVLICIWMFLVMRVRKQYGLAFQDKLGLKRQTTKIKDPKLSDTSVVEGIQRTLQSGTTKQILFLLDRIEESKEDRLMKYAIPLLTHNSPKVRQAALRCLYYHSDHSITRQIEPLLKDPDDEVRSRAFSCLLAHTRQNRVRFIDGSLRDKDPAISGAALVGLATEARDNPEMQQLFNLQQRLEEKINETGLLSDPVSEMANKIMVARMIGYGKLSAYYPYLKGYINDKNPALFKKAMLSAGNSQDPGFIKLLLEFLLYKSTRSSAQKALAKFEPSEILPILAEVSREKGTANEILIQLPALAKTMDTQQAIDYLFELVQHHDPKVKLNALETLHKIKVKFPHLTISGKRVIPFLKEEAGLYRDFLAVNYAAQHRWSFRVEDSKISIARKDLIHLLERRLDNILKRIFWLLGLTYPPGIILPLLKDVRSQDPNIRINTIEFLDNILDPALKKVLIPIVETAIMDTLSDEILLKFQLNMPSEFSCFESILKGQDDLLKLAVLVMIEALDNPEFAPLVKQATNDEHTRVKMFAERLSEKR
ncbi:MAG: HEAT repeat domain-containing protein [Saprospiraceae bacterium]|nr:HEAT repeat domain-containing protein [Saprospiraceae bacterium]